MVSGVRVQGDQEDDGEPRPRHRRVRPQQQRPRGRRQQVGDRVLQGVRVHGRQGHGGRPLVVALVNQGVTGQQDSLIARLFLCLQLNEI